MSDYNPSLCDICDMPAMYGDGSTWAKCGKHQRESTPTVELKVVEASPAQPLPHEGQPHQTIPGLMSVIIPVYNVNYSLFHYTGHCIGAIRYFSGDNPIEIIVVDNGSTAKPGSMNDWHADKIITNETNLGYVKAVNQGIRCAFGEYIAVICTDVQVYENWIEDAKEALTKVDLVYAKPMYGEPFSRMLEARNHRAKWLDKPVEASLNNDVKDGSCLITTKKLLDTVGILDEGFFNYAADSDLFKRIEQAGLKYAGSEKIRTFHVSHATGYVLEGDAEQMNVDKEYYQQKWQGQNFQS